MQDFYSLTKKNKSSEFSKLNEEDDKKGDLNNNEIKPQYFAPYQKK